MLSAHNNDTREPTERQIKAVVFDFGKVLANFDHMATCEELAAFSPYDPEEIYQRIFKEGLEKSYDEGKITSREFYAAVTKTITADERLDFETFTRVWGDIFTESKDIENVLGALSSSIRLILLSNTNEIHWEYIKELPVVRKFFGDEHRVVLSFQNGCRKPDVKIYQEAIRRASCTPEDIVYIDDIPEYVNTFTCLGAGGIVYDCSKDPISKLRDGLMTFGIL